MNHARKTKQQLISELTDADNKIADLNQILKNKEKHDETLRKNEERYRDFLENVDDECYETDLMGNITYINDIGAARSGFSREEMIGMNNRRYTRPEEAKRIFKIFSEIYNTGKPAMINNYEIATKDGQNRVVEMSVSLIRDDSGKPMGFRGISRDITQTRKELADAERFRNFVKHVRDACFEFDLNGRCTFCNEAVLHILGYTSEEFMNLPFRKRHPSREETDRVTGIIKNIYNTGMPSETYESKYIRRDGSIVTVEMVVSPIWNDQKAIVGFRGVGRDITARKKEQAEQERYRDFLENINDACYEMDLKGNITYANEAAAYRSGYTREEMIGMNNRQNTNPDEANRIFKIFNQVYQTGKPATISPYEVFSRTGQKRFVEMAVSLIRDNDGIPAGFRGISRDLTTRMKEQTELQRYRNFLENLDEGCFETDLAGNITFANEVAARNIGYTRDEFIGMNNRQYTNPQEARRVLKFFNDVFETGKPATIENTEAMNPNGQIKYLDIFVSLMRDAHGHPIGFRGTSRDVTERKKAREELERYRDFMENIADGCFENDLAGTITYSNEIGAKRLGLTREEFIGMNNSQHTTLEETKRINKIFGEIYRTGKPAYIDSYELIRKDGQILIVEMSASLIRDASGKPIGFRGTTRDITEKKKIQDTIKASEAKYRFLTEKISDIVWTTDADALITYVSPSIEAALGYTQAELLGRSAADLTTSEPLGRGMSLRGTELARRLQESTDPQKVISFESSNYHKNGSIVWLDNVISIIYDDSGKIAGVHGVSRDITQQKSAAAEREKLIGDLKAALAEVKKLSGMLPICAHCKKIRDDKGYWNQMENYISKHSDALFSHCICPDCASRLYSDYIPLKKK